MSYIMAFITTIFVVGLSKGNFDKLIWKAKPHLQKQ